ncbi:MAG: TIR domain-containing protein [Verrucomicrobiota bacterium]
MSTLLDLIETMTKRARRTFFSFHYLPDNQRAQVVKQSWLTKPDREAAGFFDSSAFETKKRTNDALKAFLNEQLKGTTVTCVLIGAETALRPWVRYELVRSFYRGNGLFGVRINGIKNFAQQNGTAGLNPFDLLAYSVADNRVSWKEKNNGIWVPYNEVPSMALSDVAYDLKEEHNNTFACRFPIYDWANDNGYNNLGTWIDRAARQAGK